MSAVRMCDKCSRVFSENADGWSTLQGTTIKRVEGRPQAVHQTIDLCPACVSQPAENPYAALEPRRETPATIVDHAPHTD